MARYYHVSALKIGATTYTTIESVDIKDKFTRLMGKGDADNVTTFQARGSGDVSVSIKMQDALQAQAIMDAPAGDLTFNGLTSGGGTKPVTVKNFQAFDRDGGHAHDKIDQITITGFGADPTGAGPVYKEGA